ncbi:MAG: hypothetical protein JWM11_571 [Planctomycetaceae bacterium]|nr:hypothetical protein [Planctomycetaceae bacterium]
MIHREVGAKLDARHSNWRRIAVLGGLGIVVAFIFVAVFIRLKELHELKDAARQILIGDSPAKVYSLLGNPTHGYVSGSPSAGAPSPEYGDIYGGRIDYLCHDLAVFVDLRTAGLVQYSYFRNFASWPVRIHYNGDKQVTAVYLDGIQTQ